MEKDGAFLCFSIGFCLFFDCRKRQMSDFSWNQSLHFALAHTLLFRFESKLIYTGGLNVPSVLIPGFNPVTDFSLSTMDWSLFPLPTPTFLVSPPISKQGEILTLSELPNSTLETWTLVSLPMTYLKSFQKWAKLVMSVL